MKGPQLEEPGGATRLGEVNSGEETNPPSQHFGGLTSPKSPPSDCEVVMYAFSDLEY